MFTKLFSSITESSLWSEPKEVRLLFVTMLAKADQTGFVEASIPGLARVANLTIEETEAGLKCLLSPDNYSKNPAFEGRRIIEAKGGFMLLNYEDYRSRRSPEERREYMREYMRDYRKQSKQPVNNGKPSLNAVSPGKPPLAQAEAETEAETEVNTSFAKGEQVALVDDVKPTSTEAKPTYPAEFNQFWAAYPKRRRTKKLETLRKWKIAIKQIQPEALTAKAAEYAASEIGRSEFAVMPSVWLNGGCWEDDPAAWRRGNPGAQSAGPQYEPLQPRKKSK